MSCMYTAQGDFICKPKLDPIIEKFEVNDLFEDSINDSSENIISVSSDPSVLNNNAHIVFNYIYNSDNDSGQTEYTFIVKDNDLKNANVLIVGGGGGGGAAIFNGNGGGGGGGGDVYEAKNITIPVGKHTIKVGKGGSGGMYSQNTTLTFGKAGYDSSLILNTGKEYTYCGGGGGGSAVAFAEPARFNNYSSGGGGGAANIEDVDISGNHKSGNGSKFLVGGTTAGGGGGSSNDTDGNSIYIMYDSNNIISNGGNGTKSSITNGTVNYGSGGGGGCLSNKNIPGSGVLINIGNTSMESGFGGKGLENIPAQNGTDGIGNGGGGGGHNSNNIYDDSIISYNRKGGDGGSGVVIIKCDTMIQ